MNPTSRERRFLEVYRRWRERDQEAWYESSADEFEAAHEQAIDVSAWLMAGTAIAAALAAANAADARPLWAVIGAALPALSGALAAYEKLFAFDQQAKVYRDAAVALQLARASAPGPSAAADARGFQRALRRHVTQVESIFSREQGQWGQLIVGIESVSDQAAADQDDAKDNV
jgi:hypothetical protein